MVLARFYSENSQYPGFWQHCCSETTVFVGAYEGSNLVSKVF